MVARSTIVTTGAFTGEDKVTSVLHVDQVKLEVATPEQAAFKIMYFVKRQSHEEASQVMESLTSLRPQIAQQLLEYCTSVKIKRLFMNAAERSNHAWLKPFDAYKVDLGSRRRTMHAEGSLDSKHDLVVANPQHGQMHRWAD